MKAKRFLTPGLLLVSGCALALSFSSPPVAATDHEQTPAAARDATDLSSLPEILNDWSVQRLDVPDHAGSPFGTRVLLDGKEELLLLHPHSIRARNFRLLEDDGSGVLKEVVAPPPATYRGEVADRPGSLVAASLIDGKLRASVWIDDVQYGIEPLSDYEPVAPAPFHVVYAARDLIEHGYTCGVDDHAHAAAPIAPGGRQGGLAPRPTPKRPQAPGSGQGGPDGLDFKEEAEVAYDTDYEYYLDMGSSSTNVMNTVEDIQNGVNLIYERDVEICMKITTILVRTSSNDPYSSTSNPSTLLNEFAAHWNNNQSTIQRDVATMWTGRSNGGVIGIAWVSVICSLSSAYDVNWNFTSNRTQRIDLVAHEQGHNWGSDHCCAGTSCSGCYIMCPAISSCSGGGRFGSFAQGEIAAHKSTRLCLRNGCGPTSGGLVLRDPIPGQAGRFNTFSCTSGTAGETMTFWWGKKSGTSSVPGCSATLGLDKAKVASTVTVGAQGFGSFIAFVPYKAAGATVHLQVAQTPSCELSNIVIETF